MSRYLVVSTSGNPSSNSRKMGRLAFHHLTKSKVDCEWLDLGELDLPLCDAEACYGKQGAQQLARSIKAADGILVAAPVYNYDVSAAAKNMIELTGSAGYGACLLLMLAVAIGQILYFKKRRWL